MGINLTAWKRDEGLAVQPQDQLMSIKRVPESMKLLGRPRERVWIKEEGSSKRLRRMASERGGIQEWGS